METEEVKYQKQVIVIATSLCNSKTLEDGVGDWLTWHNALKIAKEMYDHGLRMGMSSHV
jgi:hypothetical protein